MLAENLEESMMDGVLSVTFLGLCGRGDGSKLLQGSSFLTISKSSDGEDSGLNRFRQVIIGEGVGAGTLTGLVWLGYCHLFANFCD